MDTTSWQETTRRAGGNRNSEKNLSSLHLTKSGRKKYKTLVCFVLILLELVVFFSKGGGAGRILRDFVVLAKRTWKNLQNSKPVAKGEIPTKKRKTCWEEV